MAGEGVRAKNLSTRCVLGRGLSPQTLPIESPQRSGRPADNLARYPQPLVYGSKYTQIALKGAAALCAI